ncbi:hypothetical protein NDU88_001479 [Pleurodeles waltl]|uniref:Uncharacterized protein n=1 Tax=Pleurodeles waltl TaxID=8319 RepID=A0AAV7V8L0_PLEWA|nr:hypothetical protein NDU88_001479 [Pleurodeles waltl]
MVLWEALDEKVTPLLVEDAVESVKLKEAKLIPELAETADPEWTAGDWLLPRHLQRQKTMHCLDPAQTAREQAKAVEEVMLLSATSFAPLDSNHSLEASSEADNSETLSSTGLRGPALMPRLVGDLL